MDRLEEIKNGSFTAGDVIWLVSEVERLRAVALRMLAQSINHKLKALRGKEGDGGN